MLRCQPLQFQWKTAIFWLKWFIFEMSFRILYNIKNRFYIHGFNVHFTFVIEQWMFVSHTGCIWAVNHHSSLMLSHVIEQDNTERRRSQ